MAGLLRVTPDVMWLSLEGDASSVAEDGVACSPARAAAILERASEGWSIRNARATVRIAGARLGGSSRHLLVHGDLVRIATTLFVWQASPPRANGISGVARAATALALLEAGDSPVGAPPPSGITQGELRTLIARGLSAREIAARAGWSLAYAKEKIRARNAPLRR